jgi:hypothetical protein
MLGSVNASGEFSSCADKAVLRATLVLDSLNDLIIPTPTLCISGRNGIFSIVFGHFVPKKPHRANKKKQGLVSFFCSEVLPVNEQAMENPTASELIKKLAEGKISRKEFDLFLSMLDDKKQTENLDEGFWTLFAQLVDGNGSDPDKGNNLKE